MALHSLFSMFISLSTLLSLVYCPIYLFYFIHILY